MKESRKFDLLNSPVEGANLIEASAGTGKTYAITGIFLRLLLEKRLSVGEILVVTYTVAATEELRDRIRRTIYGAIHAIKHGGHEDPFLDGLAKRYRNDIPTNVIPVKTGIQDLEDSPFGRNDNKMNCYTASKPGMTNYK